MHGQVRFRIFALVPMTRLLILITALAIIVPIIIEPSLRNMVTLLGALGLAIGFAMKDYVSSLIAGVVSAVELLIDPATGFKLKIPTAKSNTWAYALLTSNPRR